MTYRHLLPLILSVCSAPLWAIQLKSGDWTIDISGNVNAYYTQMNCSGTLVSPQDLNTDTPKGIAAFIACDNYNQKNATNINNGFLPNSLIFSVENTRGKLHVGGVVGLYFSSGDTQDFQSGRSSFQSNKNLDIRQAYVSFGSEEAGFFKLGRDYGLFGFNALVGSANTVSVGTPSGAYSAHRIALGNVGAGTIYPPVQNSFTYTSPEMKGFSASVAISSPLSPRAAQGIYYRKLPSLSAQVNYHYKALHTWATMITQQLSTAKNLKTNAFAYELGADYTLGHGFGFLVNYQSGAGLGLIELFDHIQYDPITNHIDKTRVNNILLGASYRRGQLKVAYTFGRTSQHLNHLMAGDGRLDNNTNQTLGLYYSVTTNLTVSAEYDRFKTRNFGTTAVGKAQGISVGAALIF